MQLVHMRGKSMYSQTSRLSSSAQSSCESQLLWHMLFRLRQTSICLARSQTAYFRALTILKRVTVKSSGSSDRYENGKCDIHLILAIRQSGHLVVDVRNTVLGAEDLVSIVQRLVGLIDSGSPKTSERKHLAFLPQIVQPFDGLTVN